MKSGAQDNRALTINDSNTKQTQQSRTGQQNN